MTLRDEQERLLAGDEDGFLRACDADIKRLAAQVMRQSRAYGYGSDDAADMVQEMRISVLHARKTYDPARGPFMPHLLHVVRVHAARRVRRQQGWTGQSLQHEPVHIPESALSELVAQAYEFTAEEKHTYGSRVAALMYATCDTEEERDVVALALKHGVGGVLENAAPLARWYQWDEEKLERDVRRVLRTVAQRCVREQEAGEQDGAE